MRSILVTAILCLATPAFALDGTWVTAGGSAWDNAANWAGNNVANGTNATADFSIQNITSASTVTLDSNHTIGTLLFGDTTPDNDWTLDGTGIITLAVNSGSPTINITNRTLTVGVLLNGSQGFNKTGPGTLVLTNNNALAGDINILQGTLDSRADGLYFTTGQINVSPGAALLLHSSWVAGSHYQTTNLITLSGTGISASLGAMNIGENFNCRGGITLLTNARITHDWNNGDISGTITATNRNLELYISVGGQTRLAIGGSINLGGGTLTVNSVLNASPVELNASNSLSETILTNYATIKIGNAGALGNGGLTLYPGTTLNLNTNNISIAFLGGSGGGITDTGTVGTTTLTVTQSIASTFSGTISNGASRTVALTKSGSGTLTFTGTNTYSGITTITNGTLILNGVYSSDTNGFLVSGSGILGGTGTISRAVTVTTAGAIDPGSAPGILGTSTVASNVTFSSGGGLRIDLSGSACDFLQVNGSVTVLAGTASVLPQGDPGTKSKWTIMHADGGISGNFKSSDSKYYVTVEGNDLVLQKIATGTCIIIK